MRVPSIDTRFLALLNGLAGEVPRAATLLGELLAAPAERRHVLADVKHVERGANALTHELINDIGASYESRIDGRDFSALAHHLGGVIDLIGRTCRLVQMFGIATPQPRASELAGIIASAAALIANAVASLHEPRRVLQDVAALPPLYGEGVLVHATAVTSLFDPRSAPNVLDVIKWKGVFDQLEETIAKCHEVGQILEAIAMKHKTTSAHD